MEADFKKLEFMAAVKLVPPAVLEEISRRQRLCKAELGSWWEREHGKQDFCLVMRADSSNCGSNAELFEHVEPVEVQREVHVSTEYNPVEITTTEYTGLSNGHDNNSLYQSQS